jgi:manganese oxidase
MSRIHWSLMLCLLLLSGILSGCGNDSGSSVSPLSLISQASHNRTYYIAAEDVVWDFAPTGVDQLTGIPFANLSTPSPARPSTEFVMTRRVAFDPVSSAVNPGSFTAEPAGVQIGTRYKKTLFFEYTDASFTQKKPVPAEWRHLGALGPIIRAEVGDTILVVFKNKTGISRSFTMHPHGVFYTKANEGAPYVSGDPDAFSAGNNVPPGSSYTYTWPVPERAGPGPGDGMSVLWMYHSHFDETRDENTGLIGPMIIYAKGSLRPDGTVVGVDREFVTLFKVYDENTSFHFRENLQSAKLTSEMIDEVMQDEGFDPEPNLKHSINGYLFGNMPLQDITMRKGEHVRWYLMSMGTEIDLHTPHWHGNTVLEEGMRTDVIDLLPAQMLIADMVPDNVGTWLFHCHVNDHLLAGMVGRYRVIP